jgi:hypothetical protein
MTPETLLAALRASWSRETSSGWREDNPARGQCNVTALVVQDHCGGEILKTPTPEGWHFYNRVAGLRHDLTAGQFAAPPVYENVLADREEALSGTTAERYTLLASRVSATLAAPDQRHG